MTAGTDYGTQTLQAWHGYGTSWADMPVSTSAATPQVLGVSCTSELVCLAVGQDDGPGTTLGERWNVESWWLTPVADAPADSKFNAVSCTGDGFCMAVGDSWDGNTGTNPLAEQYLATMATETRVSSSLNPSTYGQSVTFTATVIDAVGGGTVDFRADGNEIAGCTAQSLQLVSNVYQATCTTSALSGGGHLIEADYSGDSRRLASIGSAGQMVQQAATQLSAEPALLQTASLNVTALRLSAHLTITWSGAPAVGELVHFTTPATPLCDAVTAADGWATCQPKTPSQLAALLTQGGYTARFDGNNDYLRSRASAPLAQ